MGCPNCHEPFMLKSIEIDISEDWEHFRCGRCQTRFKQFYENETLDERKQRIKRREDRKKMREIYGQLKQREEAIS